MEMNDEFAKVKTLLYTCKHCHNSIKLYELDMPIFGGSSVPYDDPELVKMIASLVENNKGLRDMVEDRQERMERALDELRETISKVSLVDRFKEPGMGDY